MPAVRLEIANPSGLHARPAAVFVKTAARFASAITLVNPARDPTRSASAKSILGVLSLGVSKGDTVVLDAEGADAEAAIEALTELVRSGMGEPVDG